MHIHNMNYEHIHTTEHIQVQLSFLFVGSFFSLGASMLLLKLNKFSHLFKSETRRTQLYYVLYGDMKKMAKTALAFCDSCRFSLPSTARFEGRFMEWNERNIIM